jgi:hypothetical protein
MREFRLFWFCEGRKMKKADLIAAALIIFLIIAASPFLSAEDINEPQQSKTGPNPPESVLERDKAEIARLKSLTLAERKHLLETQYTILGVPEYFWRHGCGPTSVGMVVGYYDICGYGDLVPGDASTQTTAVNQAIASGGNSSNPNGPGFEKHYEDYARPEDYYPTMLQDDYIGKRSPHTDDCIADYMDTSKSTRGNYYGWSWSSDVGPSFIDYVNQQNSSYNPTYTQYAWSSGLWGVLQNEINSNRPMVFLVDTDGDGSTDHFVPVIGYDDSEPHKYACYTTWAGMPGIRWETFRGMASGSPWGIWGGWSFKLTIAGDFDGNGWEDLADFAIFASAWMSRPGRPNWNPACDISKPKDNIIDWRDLAVFTQAWLAGIE